ncbi:MAG TPA: glutamate 5-kinase [Thermosulfidibacter takaii]|uniref:Glutamate 5-kinase n=1 Tax=Thermosulfidibacter takaii TaxID=412593 RepID=A0A7C0YDW0_9BACT|nr:glutamate 5-kinase [Thermosulfidibacter takaii]
MRGQYLEGCRRLVVKVGSGVIAHPQGGLREEVVSGLALDLADLRNQGMEVILVSSGAVAAGIGVLGLQGRPKSIPAKQACAAVGQAHLIWAYERHFERWGQKVAQVLLTRDDLEHRRRYLNARNALFTILKMGVIPIINENDTVMVEEIKFGDNDNLSALVAMMAEADLLVILSTVEGLYTCDPSRGGASLLREVKSINGELWKCDVSGLSPVGTGGMASKVEAIKKVVASGIPAVIALGDEPRVLWRILEGEEVGTFFLPREERLVGRKMWIGYTLQPVGSLVIDDGAVEALVRRGKSLLPRGVLEVRGAFEMGDPVSCLDKDGREVARGLVNYSSPEIEKIKGVHSSKIQEVLGYHHSDEVIHRDNLVVLYENL